MVEEYAQSLDAGTDKRLSSFATVHQHRSKALPESGILEQHNQSQELEQKYKEEGELHDALRHKVRLILQVIEREERGRHAILYESAATNQVATDHNRYPLEKKPRVPERVEHQNSRGKSVQEVDPMTMDRDAEEMLYNMLMTRFSNVAIFGPNPPRLILDRPKLSSPPSYTSADNVPGQNAIIAASHDDAQLIKDHHNLGERALQNYGSLTQSRPPHRLSLDKPLPPLELVDILEAGMHQAGHARNVEREYASINHL
jgi:hypothetical protein